VKRILFLLVLAMGLMLAACDASDSHGKAAKDERPDSGLGAKKEAKRFERESQSSPAGAQYSSSSAASEQYSRADADYSSGSSPEDVLASQYRHINAGHYGQAYDLFDDQSQQLISQEQYEAYFASSAPYEITSYSFSSVQSQGDSASVVADLAISSASGEDAYQVTQQLVRENGSWRVVMRDEQVTSFAAVGSPSASASASASAAPTSASASSEGGSSGHDATVTVSRVVDGDTIEVSPAVGGIDEVRLIGIDTPETKDPTEGVEPFGPEASTFVTDELSGQSVGLKFDVEREDQYGRLLAYVYVGSEMFNEVLVEEGYAQAYPYPPNTSYANRFEEAQDVARVGGLGIWGLSLDQQCQLANHGNGIGEGSPGCGTTADEPASATSGSTATSSAKPSGGGVPPVSEERCPPSAPIKGNEDSGIYHMPGDAYYDATHPEECFATPQDAEAAGYRAAKV
jgi:micrococcal nuclease